MKFSAVIFDMDGLMFDTERVSQRAWKHAAADYGYIFPENIYPQIIGRARPDVERICIEAFGKSFPFEAVYRAKQSYMQEELERDGIPLKPGLIPLLDRLKALSIKAAIASSSPRAIVLHNLERAGLAVLRFHAIVSGEDVPRSKPAPDIFLEVTRRLDVQPRDCLVLEDSNAGVTAAHAAGMPVVMIPDLVPPTAETTALARRVLDSLADVHMLLDG